MNKTKTRVRLIGIDLAKGPDRTEKRAACIDQGGTIRLAAVSETASTQKEK